MVKKMFPIFWLKKNLIKSKSSKREKSKKMKKHKKNNMKKGKKKKREIEGIEKNLEEFFFYSCCKRIDMFQSEKI